MTLSHIPVTQYYKYCVNWVSNATQPFKELLLILQIEQKKAIHKGYIVIEQFTIKNKGLASF
jgi:hypothetical protein